MQSAVGFLFVLVLCVTLLMAVFALLWMQSRSARRIAEAEATRRFEQARLSGQNLAQLAERMKRAVEELEALRESTAQDQARTQQEIAHWQGRYQRLSHWEGVEDYRQREQQLRETVAVLERAVEALRNVVEGYGSRYVVPPQSLLDEIARDAGYREPGMKLREARERSRRMVRDRQAAEADHPDPARARLAADFAVDAFNGKVEAILAVAKSDNIGTLRQRMEDAFVLINEQGIVLQNARVREEYLKARLLELKWAVRVAQLKQEEREEQRRLQERMREEAKVQRELERAQREARKHAEDLARERALIEEARARAEEEQRANFESRLREELARASEAERAMVEAEFRAKMAEQAAAQREEYETRLAETDARLAEALAARQRAKSMAQQTKRGTVYVISNIGSFGESVFKIGQTRRLDPMERIWELGDASVPFDFDVHALIACEDAPKLEGWLHEQLALAQVNKMNWRKEFFRVELAEIRSRVEEVGLHAEWTMAAQALQFRETQALEQRLREDSEFRERWLLEQRGVGFESAPVAGEIAPMEEQEDE